MPAKIGAAQQISVVGGDESVQRYGDADRSELGICCPHAQIINDAADKFEITLNEDQFNQLKALLEKLGGLNLDLGSLKSQAQAAYDTLKDMGFDISKIHIDTEEAKGIFQQIIDMIKGWFN